MTNTTSQLAHGVVSAIAIASIATHNSTKRPTTVNLDANVDIAADDDDDTIQKPDYSKKCSVTIYLIIFICVIYIIQYYYRTNRRRMITTYHEIIEKQKYCRVWIAILSHPPAEADNTQPSSLSPLESNLMLQTGYTDNYVTNSRNNITIQNNLLQRLQDRVMTFAETCYNRLTKGLLSGLPILVYNAHILWTCRGLEGYYDSDLLQYVRVLVSLSLIALSLELSLAHRAVQVTKTAELLGSSRPEGALSVGVARKLRKSFANRTIATSTIITAALLFVHLTKYPHFAIQVLPFLPNFGAAKVANTSYGLSFLILSVLSKSSHFVRGVVFGTLAGFVWSYLGMDFLASAYWGNALLVVVLLVSLASLKQQHSAWIPCIDRVNCAQDNQLWVDLVTGYEVVDLDEYDDDSSNTASTLNDDDDDDVDNMSNFPSLDDDEIYRRVSSTYFDDDDSDFDNENNNDDDGEDMEMQAFYRFNTIRSRRSHGEGLSP